MGVAGIVDHDVDAPESVERLAHHLVEFGSQRHVGRHRDRGVADLRGDALGALGVQIGDDDPGALLGKAPGHALAEAGGGAGDDRDLVLEPHLFPTRD